MRLNAMLICEFGITSQFGTALLPRPGLRLLDQQSADSLPAQIGIDVPSFDITHLWRHASIHPVANRQLDESAESPFLTLENVDCKTVASSLFLHLDFMHFRLALRPKSRPHAPPLRPILRSYSPDHCSSDFSESIPCDATNLFT